MKFFKKTKVTVDYQDKFFILISIWWLCLLVALNGLAYALSEDSQLWKQLLGWVLVFCGVYSSVSYFKKVNSGDVIYPKLKTGNKVKINDNVETVYSDSIGELVKITDINDDNSYTVEFDDGTVAVLYDYEFDRVG